MQLAPETGEFGFPLQITPGKQRDVSVEDSKQRVDFEAEATEARPQEALFSE